MVEMQGKSFFIPSFCELMTVCLGVLSERLGGGRPSGDPENHGPSGKCLKLLGVQIYCLAKLWFDGEIGAMSIISVSV
jgi:hypothetical protein